MRFEKLRLIQEEQARPAAENMAVDESLFLSSADPVFRSYRWVRPSVSFGYFISWEEVSRRFSGRDLVRRWTGGGIVEHGQDFTYSLICPGSRNLPTLELYRFVHSAMATILRIKGSPVEIAPGTDPSRSAACFEKAVQFDLQLRGEKIAGAAIRRNRQGLLLQGSIQRFEVPAHFGEMLAAALSEQVESLVVPESVMEQAARIAKEKYGAAEWNCRR
jgi:lipoyl(octanoyl) transferase